MQTAGLIENDSGFSVVEVLVSGLILAIIGLASAKSSIMSYYALDRNLRNSYAMQLALEKLEELGSVDPGSLDASDNMNETNISLSGIVFSRQTNITVNPDNSRTAVVTVTASLAERGGFFRASNTFAEWGTK